MDATKKAEIVEYLQNRIRVTDTMLRAQVQGRDGKPYPQRPIYNEVIRHIRGFLGAGTEPRWIIIPGLRGVGKTTLLAQLFLRAIPRDEAQAFYLSIDEIVRQFKITLWELMEAYEEILRKPLELLDRPVFFFFDEVHYDPDWDAAIKTFYDRSKNIFVICTGSSATLLRKQISADSARRAYILEMLPLRFTEYMHLLENKDLFSDVSKEITSILFGSSTAAEVVERLTDFKDRVATYWATVGKTDIDRFFTYGTLPFTLIIPDEQVILNQLDQVLQRIIYTDIAQVNRFDTETLTKLYRLVYMLSESNEVSMTKMATLLDVSKDTVRSMLNALENADVVHRAPAHGSQATQARKPIKYLFTSPAIRYFLLTRRDSARALEDTKGKLFEDVAGLLLRYALQHRLDASLTYDAIPEGADFIVRFSLKRIPIEVGYNKNSTKQVQTSLKRHKSSYGLLITNTEDLSYSNSIATIPLQYFLLL